MSGWYNWRQEDKPREPPRVYNEKNPYGYCLNINHPEVYAAYEAYCREIGCPLIYPLTDAQRIEFEVRYIREQGDANQDHTMPEWVRFRYFEREEGLAAQKK